MANLKDEALLTHYRNLVQAKGPRWSSIARLVEHLSEQEFANDYEAAILGNALVISWVFEAAQPVLNKGAVIIDIDETGNPRVVYNEPFTSDSHKRNCEQDELERVVRSRLLRLRIESKAAR